ncbi:MAG TPA: alkaline phosphatase family protein [Bryobacteraceae bacterium]|jgi:hypothetical protein|nr:alkaline phosphatase family protein [Bryobacteraceae bacterium]
MPRNYWLSLSFANLVYLRAWADLLPPGPDDGFYRKTLASPGLYFGIVADVLLLSLLTFLVVSIAPKLPRWLQRILPVVAIAMVAMAIRSVSTAAFVRHGVFSSALAGLLALTVVILSILFFSQTVRVLQIIALAATPCLAVTLAGSLIYFQVQKPLPRDPAPAPRLAGSPPFRVLWILFDDWDERMTFSDRPAGLRLPVIDDLAYRSFNATRALAVQGGRVPLDQMSTYGAVPSLLYGKFLVRAEVPDASTMRIEFDPPTRGPIVLGAGHHLFARARARGWNAAAAGWYLPYCRVFGSQLSDCYWDVRYIPAYAARYDFAHGAVDETRMLFETAAFSPFGPSLVDLRHESEYKAILEAGRRFAADPSIGVALIHFNIPHTPYFYDPKIGPSPRYGYWGSLYNDALQWVDRSVGSILASVHDASLDGKTAIILSSDHPFRFSASHDPHVPFIVHLPGARTGVLWEDEFSTVRTADLIMAIAGGEVKSAAEVAHFVTRTGGQ